MRTIEQLTYTEIGARLGITAEAVRALVRRHHLPRLRGSGAMTLLPFRSGHPDQPETTP